MAQQYLNLGANRACPGHGCLGGNTVTWSFAVAPTPLSRLYEARIEHRQGKAPQVFIDAPDLAALADGRRLPHVYEQMPARLCLYLPGSGEWEDWMRLDQTIVPWTALWLFYFEEWLFSGRWSGGGMHPIPRKHGRNGRPTGWAMGLHK
jgi:hypothetical protein